MQQTRLCDWCSGLSAVIDPPGAAFVALLVTRRIRVIVHRSLSLMIGYYDFRVELRS